MSDRGDTTRPLSRDMCANARENKRRNICGHTAAHKHFLAPRGKLRTLLAQHRLAYATSVAALAAGCVVARALAELR